MKQNKVGDGPVQESTGPSRGQRVRRGLTIAAILVVVFYAGVGVGNGNLTNLSSGHKSVTGLPTTLDYSSVNEVYQSLKDNYNGKLTETQVLDGIKSGLAASTNDPYTEYFNPSQAKDFSNQLNNSFSGVGAELGKDDQGNLIVVSPISGFPADKAGLKAQDIITDVNGTTTSGLSVDEAVSKIRGPAGTKVTLKVVRNKSQALSFTITRDNIQIPSVSSKTLDGNIGYIQIITFGDDTSDLIKKTAQQMKSQGVKGVILDLRGNPGGEVTAAVDTASEWLPKGKLILQEKRTDGTVLDTENSTGTDDLGGIPTVVLVDGGSASASEITAGALHDNGAATIIGTKSYGKGVVQQLINLGDGSQLKVTVASWYRPNGQNINKKGITPDKIVTEPSNSSVDNDPQLQAAEAALNK